MNKSAFYQGVLILIFTVVFTSFSWAQVEQDKLIPFDSTVRTGQLDNGLTYFIKQNALPADRVELRLVVNAGSILEDQDQLGLAHFTEHMAFNGSKHFDKNELVSYLQSVGVKFGAHLNAYTSFDETVYILPIPSDDEQILEKGLTILEDWAGNLSFDQAELDKERGVVIEEWRLGQGANARMLEEYLPVIFKGSKYAERLPIGKKETLESFDRAAIKRFYDDWYRPDLMAVVAVGDIDVDKMEERIKAHFSAFRNPTKERVREEFDVPTNEEPLVAVTSDPEATNILFNIMYKNEATEFKTEKQFRQSHVQSLFLEMINQRLNDLLQVANPPYLYATTYIGSPVSRKTTAFSGFAVPKPDDIMTGVMTLLEEIRRVELHGFNESELQTVKLNMLESYESAYKERDKSKSGGIADELIRHFLEEEPVPGIAYEYNFLKDNIDGITLDEVNAIIAQWIKKENRVIYMTAPQQEGLVLPTTEEILSWVAEVEQRQLEPLAEEMIDTNLLKELPEGGSVMKRSEIQEVEVKVLELSNGAKVYLKPTAFKNDEIMFSAYRKGGTSLAEDKDFWSASFASNIVSLSGIGDYSYTQLEKALAGKSVGISPYISDLESGFNGNTSPKDIETMFQLIHLYFTSVRTDEEAFQSLIQRNKAILSNVLSNPSYYFQDQLARIMSQNDLRGGGIPTVEDLEKVKLNDAINFFKSQFDSPSHYTYLFVGNYDEETLIPMIEQYLGGGMPVKDAQTWKDRGLRPPSGMVDEKIYKGTEPQSSVVMAFNTEKKYKRADSYYVKTLSEVMDIRLIEILREEKGGVYGVGASGQGQKSPYEHYSMQVQFPCAPENVEDLVGATIDLIEDIKINGVSQVDLNKVKETQRREMELNWKENGFWLGAIKTYVKSGFELSKIAELDRRIEALEAKDIQGAAKKYLNTDAYIKVVLYPENVE
ncbi:insulinase family protein [Reichenbachiella agarivorans]|uniref:Insulinase family protein n=1 Tax=Reichenbachiella agarivorans TaxID=2979464 RepID=A0ABY6CSI1_9BACT|nr:M16 family metallopeptidase [Reichenbachiella agarivorans]UXP32950.1 insulinase family protein [Reichenbachiella agarivorans]